MKVVHKMTNHHLHHKWQWQAAITTQRLDQLVAVGIDSI